jgi:hypothetical protein
MPWDYSIYPELTESQQRVFSLTGETLYMIQMAEDAIQICSIFVFEQQDFSIEKIYSAGEKARKKTLGQLLSDLRKRTKVHPKFGSILKAFVEKRNFFAHRIFNDPEFALTPDENCKKTERFLLDLQDDAWNVQNVFLGCLMNWAKEEGVYEHLPETLKKNKHLLQVQQRPFHLLFEDSSGSDTFDQIDIVYKGRSDSDEVA